MTSLLLYFTTGTCESLMLQSMRLFLLTTLLLYLQTSILDYGLISYSTIKQNIHFMAQGKRPDFCPFHWLIVVSNLCFYINNHWYATSCACFNYRYGRLVILKVLDGHFDDDVFCSSSNRWLWLTIFSSLRATERMVAALPDFPPMSLDTFSSKCHGVEPL